MAKPKRTFPTKPLEQALRIPQALREKNGGNPWSPELVAKALGVGAGGGNFFYVAAASRDYGLTKGSRDTKEIALTELGRQAVYPESDTQEQQARVQAFLHVEPFKRVLAHYGGNNLPERKFLENTLQQTFGVDPSFHDDFVDIFEKNCRFLGIGAQFTAGAAPAQPATPSTGLATNGGAVTVATPDGEEDAPVCFVAMPFTERDDRHDTGFFNEVLGRLFTPAATKAGFRVKTAKRQGSDVIQSTIVNDLLDADLVLVDLTEHNPNVLFELGLRMKEGKPIALVRARGTGPIFDVDNILRVAEYDPNLWSSTIESDIPKISDHIKATWDNRDTSPTFMEILVRQSAAPATPTS